MGSLALLLYLIGFAATATSPLDDSCLFNKPVWVTLAVAAGWPVLAVVLIVGRFWRVVRHG
jgi:hypothetical protein